MRLALAGDTMLGRNVGDRLREAEPAALVSAEVVAAFREADLVVLNLECCISERGSRWPPARLLAIRRLMSPTSVGVALRKVTGAFMSRTP